MTLQKEFQIKITGEYLKGSIAGNVFRTENLVNFATKKNEFSIHLLKKVVAEMTDLIGTMEGKEVADILAPDEFVISETYEGYKHDNPF